MNYMSDKVLFLDTNILVYLFDVDEPEKKTIAEGIFGEYPEIRLSTQVLQEFHVTVTRKLGRPMPPEQALTVVEQFQTYPVAVITNQVVTKASAAALTPTCRFGMP